MWSLGSNLLDYVHEGSFYYNPFLVSCSDNAVITNKRVVDTHCVNGNRKGTLKCTKLIRICTRPELPGRGKYSVNENHIINVLSRHQMAMTGEPWPYLQTVPYLKIQIPRTHILCRMLLWPTRSLHASLSGVPSPKRITSSCYDIQQSSGSNS